MMVKERARPGCCVSAKLGAWPCPCSIDLHSWEGLEAGIRPGSRHQPQLPGVLILQAAFLPGELGLSSPGPLSPSGVKSASQYYPSYPSNPRRRAADSGLGELELGTCVCKGQCDLDWRLGWLPLSLGGHRGQRASQWVF